MRHEIIPERKKIMTEIILRQKKQGVKLLQVFFQFIIRTNFVRNNITIAFFNSKIS